MKMRLLKEVERIANALRGKKEVPVLRDDQVISLQDTIKTGAFGALHGVVKGVQKKELLPESPQDTIRKQQQIIDRQQQIIDAQKDTITEQKSIIVRDSRSSKLSRSVSIAVWAIVGGVGVAVNGQISPESGLQESASFVVKKISDTPTGYELIQEGKGHAITIKKQDSNLKKQARELQIGEELNGYLRKITAGQEELIGLQKFVISELNERQLRLEQKKLSPVLQKREKGKVVEHSPAVMDTTSIVAAVSSVKKEVMLSYPGGDIYIRFQEQSGGRVLLWVEQDGKKSLGFFADSPKFKNRLTKQGMNKWVQDSINQFLLVEQIESIALERNIGPSKNNPISIKTKKMYTGNVEVTLFDAFSKKSSRFIVDGKKDRKEDITGKIDVILGNFLS